jgi:uncharacterized membrane protein
MQVDGDEAFLMDRKVLLTNPLFQPSLVLHGISSSISLLIVSLLVLYRLEKYLMHRTLGKIALSLILFFTVPSGLFLSFYTAGGGPGKFLFVILSFYTAWVVVQGYQAIRQKRIHEHRLWMIELLILLCSAITLRLYIVFFVMVFEWYGNTMYFTATLLSWIPGIVLFKLIIWKKRKSPNNL